MTRSGAPGSHRGSGKGARRRSVTPLPRTFQGRLSLAFTLVFALAVGVVAALTLVVLNRNLEDQERANLASRAQAVALVVSTRAQTAVEQNRANLLVVSPGAELNPDVRQIFATPPTLDNYANEIALADLRIRFGLWSTDDEGSGEFSVARDVAAFSARLTAKPKANQARDEISYTEVFRFPSPGSAAPTWALEVSLSAPYTNRVSTLQAVAGFLALTSLGAMLFAVVVASILARRFTRPLRRLTEAARALAEGHLDRRVPVDRGRTGTVEIQELSRQFNAMAEQVQETMEVISRDRDRSREFLADVSHELRTPLAALRTFNELLQEAAGADPAARQEFLEASGQQIERLDWLAMNLLELSKLDSGLVRLDLRPEDLRTTVKSAVGQTEPVALRRGVELAIELPPDSLRVWHDPPRIGQVVSNLVGNAVKFTPRGGSVRVIVAPDRNGGARIEVRDTGVGIDARELPHIFERFYRGSMAHEARGSGSGLGLAIVRSIVEMHGGRVSVESRVGSGSTFTVILPADPRVAGGLPAQPAMPAAAPPVAAPLARPAGTPAEMPGTGAAARHGSNGGAPGEAATAGHATVHPGSSPGPDA